MIKKVISIDIDSKSIDRAIKEIEQYKKDLLEKLDIYRERIAEEIKTEAQFGFNSSTVDEDIVSGSSRKADVSVSVTPSGNISVIVANGEDAVWCEFGSGVFYNGAVGSSPNPYGASVGFTIGSYGQGKGSQKAWGYYEDDTGGEKKVVITRGTPATMPMYNAAISVATRAISIAKEVFG